MFGTIAITDYDWYRSLLAMGDLDEVNFWRPSARTAFHAEPYSPFFFKLRSPNNAIVGFALFDRYIALPDWLAWECFEKRNGCESFQVMSQRIHGLRDGYRYVREGGSNQIGCIILARPQFFPKEMWIPQPEDWKVRTQVSKRYDITVGEGRRVWLQCQERARTLQHEHWSFPVPETPEATVQFLYRLAKQRVGQGTFRVNVSDAYDWACSVTHEHSLPGPGAVQVHHRSGRGREARHRLRPQDPRPVAAVPGVGQGRPRRNGARGPVAQPADRQAAGPVGGAGCHSPPAASIGAYGSAQCPSTGTHKSSTPDSTAMWLQT